MPHKPNHRTEAASHNKNKQSYFARTLIIKFAISLAAPILFATAKCRGQTPPGPITHFIGGLWFDGSRFQVNDFYVEDGVLTHHPSSKIGASTVDLHSGFVIPPFGDAHEHNFDSLDGTPTVTKKYMADGIFYAQGMTDITSGSRKVAAARLVDTPATVDVTYAHGCLTAPEGHPKEVYESLANGFYYPATTEQRAKVIDSHRLAGDAYWEINSANDFDAKWPAILTARPDLIKIILSDSEHYTADSREHPPLGKGLDPALVPLITARAHAAGLKVAAHVDTATDYHIALTGGVDEMGHLPGYGIRAQDSIAPFRISDPDIALSASRGVRVQATAGIYVDEHISAADLAQRQASQSDNLRRLKAAGVPILIGSDHYGEDSRHEADYLQSLGLWSNLEMLRMWSVTTPLDIFPQRKIGHLEEGYEASFLVLNGNPLEKWSEVHEISARWKQGHLVDLPETTPAPANSVPTQSVNEDNFKGKLYLPSSRASNLALIVIGGSEGHLYEADEIAPQLAALGFEVLGIDYHDGFNGTRRLAKVPIETFTSAASWLRTKRGARRVVVIGDSRGSEAALLAGAYDSDISGVAAFAPSNVVWGGYGDDDIARASAWTWKGQPIAFLSFPKNPPAGAAGFGAALDQEDAERAAEIPVERINGPVLLAGSDADAIWPSGRMVRMLEKRLDTAGFPFTDRSLTYPDSSHRLLGTGPSATTVTYTISGKDYRIDFGGTPNGTKLARNAIWDALAAFLRQIEEGSSSGKMAHVDTVAQALLERVKAATERAETMTADFQQTDQFEKSVVGSLRLMKPGFTAISYRRDAPKGAAPAYVISDGKTLWRYADSSKNQYTIETAAPNGNGIVDWLGGIPIQSFYGLENAVKSGGINPKNLTYIGTRDWEGASYEVVRHDFEEEGKRYTAWLYIGSDDLIHRQVGTYYIPKPNGDPRTFEVDLRNIKTNVPMKAVDFAYAPPADAVRLVPKVPLATGATAPDFAMEGKAGSTIRLSDYRGKVVVLDFWATWCLPCLREMAPTNLLAARYKKQGVVVLTVNVWDSKQACDTWLLSHPKYDALVFARDPAPQGNDAASSLYNATAIPIQYVIGADGKVSTSLVGYSGPSDDLANAIETALTKR